MHHRTIWCVSALCSMRRVGSSAASRWSPWPSLSSSALAWASIAIGSSGSGIDHGCSTSGWSLSDRVSPVSARDSLAIAQMSPAMHGVDRPLGLAQRRPTARRCARPRRGPRGRVSLAEERREVTGDVHGRVGPDGAGEDPDEADPADVGVGGRLDDLGDQRPVGVAGRGSGRRLPAGREDLGERVLERRGEARRRPVEQLVGADPGQGVDGDDRVEGAARDRALEVVDEQVAVDLLAADVAVHQPLVLGLLDHRLDQRAALLLVGVVVAEQADEPVALEQVDRHDLVAERVLACATTPS